MLDEAIRALPGMERVLPALEGLPPAYLVGGAVRDLLRGERASIDIDVAIEGDAESAARELASRLGGEATVHGRFGTATVTAPAKAPGDTLAVDLAATRRDYYPAPGALPEVEPAPLAADLERRDFSINAIAAALSEDALGRLEDPFGGAGDIDAGLVRVLHERSFSDDPGRLLRAARYVARLGFTVEPDTAVQAQAAIDAGALATLSAARVRDALLAMLAEPTAPGALALLHDWGADRALHPSLSFDSELVASAQLGSLETGADPALAALAALCSGAPDALEPWIRSLGLAAAGRDAVIAAAAEASRLAAALAPELRASDIHALLAPQPPEALALALALGAPAEPVLRFAGELSAVRLEISGADLLATGVPESPAIGSALAQTLRRKLDGELSSRDAELNAALAALRAEQARA